MVWWHNAVATFGAALESLVGAAFALVVCYMVGAGIGMGVATGIESFASIFSFSWVTFIPIILLASLVTYTGIIFHAFVVITLIVIVQIDSLKIKAAMLVLVAVFSALNSAHISAMFSNC
jgi:hypothetical protein